MTSNNNYSQVLHELKTQYEQTLAELETQTNQIKSKLTSLDTLIEHPSLGSDILSILQDASNSSTSAAPASEVAVSATPKTKEKPQKAASKSSPTPKKKKTSTAKKSASQPKTKKKPQKNSGRSSSTTLTMKKPYDQMTKMDAIQKIMQENPGKVMHTDELTMELFGELSPEQHKAEQGRMKSAMYLGRKQDRWRKVPKIPMCYIYEPSSKAEPKKSSSPKTQKSRKKS